MLEKNIEKFIFFGTALRYLQDVEKGYPARGNEAGWFVLENIEEFLRQLDELQLAVTSRAFASTSLRKVKEELKELGEKPILEERAKRIREIMKELRPTLEAEAQGMIAYVLSERRFRIDHLIKSPSLLFASEVYDRLSDFAQKDFAEAAKCLAFERPTAAAFHMLRAIEALLRDYYCKKIRRKRTTLMWGPIIQAMRAAPRRFPKVIVSQLDHIREAFRNPTAHPDKVYDIDEAQDLLAICIDATNRIIAEMK
jgi:hypothetical protein